MRIAILGLGAIGAISAYKLQQSGHEVLNVRAASKLQIKLTGKIHQLSINQWQAEPLDWLIICTKAGQTLDAVTAIKNKMPLVKQVMCIQNGMGQHQKLAQVLNATPIWAGISTEGAYRIDTHTINYAAQGQTLVGVVSQSQMANPKAVPSIFALAENIELIMLNKLAANAVINPLTAYYKCTNGELLSNKYKAHFVKLCHEVHTLYQALGWASIEPFIQRVAQIAKQTENNRSSSLQDVLAGRETELEYISGYLIAQAQHINHPMPLSKFYLKQLGC